MITWRCSKSKAIRGDMQSVSAWINMAVLEDSGGEAGAARRAPTGIFVRAPGRPEISNVFIGILAILEKNRGMGYREFLTGDAD
jgi:hypothetical protein